MPEQLHDAYRIEKKLWEEGFQRVMGLDEVGRGCLSGPVVAAGVILNPARTVPGITDSKKLKASQRILLAEQIKQHALCWTVAWCDVEEINTYNILHASLRAMAKCVKKADPQPDFLLIDGNKGIESLLIRSETVIGGDYLSASIGAASIIAKVYRDQWMSELHREYPEFGWDQNVGYPTLRHYEALTAFGYTPHHRTTFRLRTDQLYSRT